MTKSTYLYISLSWRGNEIFHSIVCYTKTGGLEHSMVQEGDLNFNIVTAFRFDIWTRKKYEKGASFILPPTRVGNA